MTNGIRWTFFISYLAFSIAKNLAECEELSSPEFAETGGTIPEFQSIRRMLNKYLNKNSKQNLHKYVL